jgi:uncharacterized protein YggE
MREPAIDRPVIARTIGIAVIGVALVAALGVASGGRATVAAATPPDGAAEHSITVHGSGRITIKPDTATFSVGIDATANKAGAAMDQASAKMAAIIAALKAKGVADADRQTTQISLNPTYDYNNGNDRPRLTGYQASQSLSVKVRRIEDAGNLIDAAVDAGANQVGGISFTVDDPSSATDQARTAAVADARHRAEALARAAGVTLGAPINIIENGGTPPQPIYFGSALPAPAADRATPVDPGTTELSVEVDVVFAIG